MAGFFKKIFSFGKKEVVEKPVEDEQLAPINWDALKELRAEETEAKPAEAAAVETVVLEAPPAIAEAAVPEPVVETPEPVLPTETSVEPAQPEQPAVPEPEQPDIPPPVEPVVPEPAPETEPQPQEVPESDLPQEVPEEPKPKRRPKPEIPPAPEPEVPATPEIPAEPDLPVEVPATPDLPVELPPEPDLPVEVPPEPDIPAAPEEPKVAAELQPTKAPEPEIEPEPEPSPAEFDKPALSPTPQEPVAAPVAVQPEIFVPAAARQEATRETPPVPPRPKVDDEALGPINWDALKELRRETAPPPVEPSTKVTVSKKVEQKAVSTPPPAPEPRLSWYQRLRQGLARSSKELSSNIAGVFTKRKLDEDTLQDLEDVLLRADLGMETALRVTDTLAASRYGKEISEAEVRAVMAGEVEKVLTPIAQALELDLSHKPHVILVVGVNGTGKTTTIGKLAAKLKEGGLSVMLAAGDTFRAAAIEQLKIWGERTGSPVISSKLGADAAGLAYDAFEQAKEAGSDVLIIDTAGRLQNKTELMAELEKIVRVLGKLDPEAPHTVLQTVDATTGQNALNQVEIFRNVAGVNGLVMTKLDGTARGGILVAIAAKHKLPVYFIGVGEQVDDLEPFSAGDFAKAIAGVG